MMLSAVITADIVNSTKLLKADYKKAGKKFRSHTTALST